MRLEITALQDPDILLWFNNQWFPAFPASANTLGDYLIIGSAVLVILATGGLLSYDKLRAGDETTV
jgi:hypothetical protein